MTELNTYQLSDDRKKLTLTTPHGNLITLWSARPDGFHQEDIDRAAFMEFDDGSKLPGQYSSTWAKTIGRWNVFLHIATGPPTWWKPVIDFGDPGVAVGWLRLLVAIAICPRGHRLFPENVNDERTDT